MEIYPSFTMIFVVFNLLGLWFKGEIFFNWWWILPIVLFQIVMQSLILAITQNILKIKEKQNFKY